MVYARAKCGKLIITSDGIARQRKNYVPYKLCTPELSAVS